MDEYIIVTPEVILEMVTIREATKRAGLSYGCIRKLAFAGKTVDNVQLVAQN